MSLKKAAIVLNGFIHDFATGYWLASLIVIWFVDGFQKKHAAIADLLGVIERFFFWNSIGAVIVILATGAGRKFTYVDNVFGENSEVTRRKMLIFKHLVLFVIFGAGGWWAFQVVYR